jgi:very-short-patch-repair endonuclease
MTNTDPDRAIEALARRQHGAFHRRQAIECGFTPRMILCRRASGAWLTLAQAVYALASHPFDWLRQVKAAQLSVPEAVISHRSAAVLHGLEGIRRGRVEMTVPGPRRHVSSLALVHRTVDLEAVHLDGIRATPISRTVVDLAGQLDRSHLARLLDGLLLEGRVSIADIALVVDRLAPGPGRGTALLRGLLDERLDGYVAPHSELERGLDRVLSDLRLPRSQREVEFRWWPDAVQRVDAVIWPWRRIVEVDGRRWHARVADFEVDRARDHEAQRHGFEVTRFSFHQVMSDPLYAVDTLLAIGAASAGPGSLGIAS